MKKILTILLTVLLLFSVSPVCIAANEYDYVLSEDMKTLTYDGNEYVSFNTAGFIDEAYHLGFATLKVEGNGEEIQKYDVFADGYSVIIRVEITYKDGSFYQTSFLRKSYLEMANAMVSGEDGEYVADFMYPDENVVKGERGDFTGEKVTLGEYELSWSDCYYLYVYSPDGKLRYERGKILSSDDDFYFVDYNEIELPRGEYFEPYMYDELAAWKITDPKVKDQLFNAQKAYYGDGLGVLEDQSFTDTFTAIFLTVIFGVIPFGVLVAAIVLMIRNKDKYRKMFAAVGCIALVELIIFTVLAVMFSSVV